MNQVHKIIIVAVVSILLILWVVVQNQSGGMRTNDVPPRPLQPSTSGYTIIAFGDSLTAGYGLPTHEAYPAQLEQSLQAAGYSVKVINSGVSGETTRGNLERATFIRSQNSDVVILGIGGNDALRLLPIAETRKNLEETITILQSGENPPVIALLEMQAPLTSGLGYKREFDAMYSELSTTYSLLLIPFLTRELFFDSANKLSDGIHYNQVGYGKAVENYIQPVMKDLLDRFAAD